MILFEHERIRVGQTLRGQTLSEPVFDRIAAWQESSKVRYLEIGHRSIRATQWVGVLQVGKEVVEILPKADAGRDNGEGHEESACYWRKVLLKMLAAGYGFDLRLDQRANLRLQSHSMLDVFFWLYLESSEKILHEGLVKAYRMVAKNRGAWRGRLVVSEDLRRNLVHRERVFSDAMEFDVHNIWNRILVAALRVVASRAVDPLLRAKAKSLLLPFQDWDEGEVGSDVFGRLRYDRRTERYRGAIELAEIVLLRQNPDLAPGARDVYSLLFDMNRLWECWVAQTLRKRIRGKGWDLRTQSSKHFWSGGESAVRSSFKVIRPDLLLIPKAESKALPATSGLPDIVEKTVLDTKWKHMNSWVPADADLKQMYAYNKLYGAHQALLLYPKPRGCDHPRPPGIGAFRDGEASGCAVVFVELPE